MTYSQLQELLPGKTLLIGLTFLDRDDGIIELYQTHGTVLELTDEGLIRMARKDASIFCIPYDNTAFKKAAEGEYRLRSNGEVVVNPDYIVTWDVVPVGREHMDKVKKYGYISPQ